MLLLPSFMRIVKQARVFLFLSTQSHLFITSQPLCPTIFIQSSSVTQLSRVNMSHGGPLTLAQKRMMAMRSENAANAPHHMPLVPAIYDHSSSASTSPRAATDNQPLASFDDIEMKDISAPTSIADSPPANYVSISRAPQRHKLTIPVTQSLTCALNLPSLRPPNLLCLLELPIPPLKPCLLQAPPQ